MTPVNKSSQPLDAILRRATRERPGPATPECAHPESLAAYWDKSLAAADRERLEAHLADCTRCQMQLAAIARADEQAIDAAQASSGIAWLRRWRIAIPALAAAAAIVVFVAMRRPATEESQRDQILAMAKREAPVREAPPIDLAAKPPSLAPAAPAAAPTAPASIVSAPASNEIAMNEAKTEAAPRAEAMSAPAPRAMARSAEVSGTAAMVAQGGAAPNRMAGSFGAASGGIAAPAPGGAAVGAGAAGGGPAASLESTAVSTFVTISAPDQSVTWIAGKNGVVQRRDADGSTHTKRSGVSTDLVAGAAPSTTVCWIVGRSGTIIRTTDGERWTLINSPTGDNLTSVSAVSANDARITTDGGRSFATTDGGASWRPQ